MFLCHKRFRLSSAMQRTCFKSLQSAWVVDAYEMEFNKRSNVERQQTVVMSRTQRVQLDAVAPRPRTAIPCRAPRLARRLTGGRHLRDSLPACYRCVRTSLTRMTDSSSASCTRGTATADDGVVQTTGSVPLVCLSVCLQMYTESIASPITSIMQLWRSMRVTVVGVDFFQTFSALVEW